MRPRPSREVVRLRARLVAADETLRAIRAGEVDAVVITGAMGSLVYTLQGADQAYRVLIESMNEGALILAPDMTVLYANQGFASMVGSPLTRIMGTSMRRFLSPSDGESLLVAMRPGREAGGKIELSLLSDGSGIPVSVSIRPLAQIGANRATLGMVVTDMSQARHTEDLLRALARRVVQVHESERGLIAVDLHDNITQVLCSILARCQALAQRPVARGGTVRYRAEAIEMRDMLGQTAETVERISRNLRPGVLHELGLVAVLREACTAFGVRTGIAIALDSVRLAVRPPAVIELAIYRILEAALDNVAKHAASRHVAVRLRRRGGFIQLIVKDDGVGFAAGPQHTTWSASGGLGLLGMHERALSVGGTLTVKSMRGAGAEISVRIALAKPVAVVGDVPRGA